MPLTPKGKKILRAMQREYGPVRGKAVFYASLNKGRIEGTEAAGGVMSGEPLADAGSPVDPSQGRLAPRRLICVRVLEPPRNRWVPNQRRKSCESPTRTDTSGAHCY